MSQLGSELPPLDAFDIPHLGTSFPEISPSYFPPQSQSNFSTWAQPHPGLTTSQPSWQHSGHLPIPDLSLTNISNAETNYRPGPPLPPRHYCLQPNCNKAFNRRGDLTRHIITVHQRSASFLCHIHRCPRGIPGKGFARKERLVNHLTSKKHGMSKADAMYEAALRNA
jgi:hypothetical protein